MNRPGRAAGTGGSVVVEQCQACDSTRLESLLFLGYLPPVNTLRPIGDRPQEQAAYPAELLRCEQCTLVQIGLIVDPAVIFPPDAAYVTGTTGALRDNFADLYREVMQLFPLRPDSLIVDLGSNDGTLLGNFARAGHRVCGVEPTNTCRLATATGIPTVNAFFGAGVAAAILAEHGQANMVTATNVLAHVEDLHQTIESAMSLLRDDGLFVSESHYLPALIEGVQYDTIYHEHLRYYSLESLRYVLARHGLEVVHATHIPTHGGSLRVYAARTGTRPASDTVAAIALAEESLLSAEHFATFRRRVVTAKLDLLALLRDIHREGGRIYAIGAPSRASTLVNYVGVDQSLVDCALEIAGSAKLNKYLPGTLIPVLDERKLFEDQPEYALLLSWHLGDRLASKLRELGYRGRFIVPLPSPRML